MKPLVYTQNKLLPWPGTQSKNILHVWAVSVAPASLCNATHKIFFDLFYPLLRVWDFPGELQHWVCLSALVLQKEQSPCSTDSSSATGVKLFLSCNSQAWLPTGKKDVCALGQFLRGKGRNKEVPLRSRFLFQTLS